MNPPPTHTHQKKEIISLVSMTQMQVLSFTNVTDSRAGRGLIGLTGLWSNALVFF